MSSFNRQFSTESPVLAISPQPAHQGSLSSAGFNQQQIPSQPPLAFAATQSAPNPGSSGANRKRSRDEAAVNLEPDAPPVQPQEPEEEWILGPGMVLMKSDKSYVADASSQSGTWLEEKKAADDEALRKHERERIVPRSHKSQRRVQQLTPSGEALASVEPQSTTPSLAPGSFGNDDNAPVVDQFTLHLGIGWRKISEDEHIQAAARGWARYIENHYPVTNAQIRLESKGLQSYLVEAAEGFFLFAEDLRQGRLVSSNVESALQNLRSSPPTFEGANTLIATESPGPQTSELTQPAVLDAEMHVD